MPGHGYTEPMPIDVAAVQKALRAEGLDGWLLYDFHGSNPSRRLGRHGSGGHLATRRWFYLIPATASRALVHAIERTTSITCPATRPSTPAAPARGGAAKLLLRREARRDGILAELRDPLRLARRRRHDRAGARARRRRRLVRRSRSSSSRRAGRRGDRNARDASEKLYRIKDRAFEEVARRLARRRRDDRVRHPAEDGRLVPRRRAGRRFGAGRLGAGERRQSALPADGEAHRVDPRRTSSCCSTLGQARRARRGLCRHHLDGFHRAERARAAARRSRAICGARCGGRRWCRTRRAGREVRGFEVDRGRAAGPDRRRLRRRHPAPHRPQPRAKTCTATAPTWTITRPTTSGGCCPAAASPSNRACISGFWRSDRNQHGLGARTDRK